MGIKRRRSVMKQEERSTFHESHIEKIEDLIGDLKYGSITIIVQDGRIVQIDKTEKYRIKD
jgi:hypothetical protein